MAIDPTKFLPGIKDTKTNCKKFGQGGVNASSARKDFFRNLGKIGEIEALNEIGAGSIGEGLRTMAKISNSVRTGEGVVPSVFGDVASSVDNKVNAVLGSMNINPSALQKAGNFSPAVANRALGQAKVLGDLVSSGEFSFNDIPTFIQDFTEADQLIRSIFTEPKNPSQEFKRCVSPYATDLISFAPKFKFLFVVEFEYAPAYNKFGDLNPAFVVKSSTRPSIGFEYDEVNMYNFRTKVIKRSMYEPMTMRFYDDNKNNAMNFYNAYLQAMVPMSNIGFKDGTKIQGTDLYDESGMDFDARWATVPGPIPTNKSSASIGALNDNTKNVLQRITLYHVYNYGLKYNQYDFYNPRITRLELDDVDMADNGNGNEVSFQFEYDGMFLTTNNQMSKTHNLVSKTNSALYPLPFVSNDAAVINNGGDGENVPSAAQQQNVIDSVISSAQSSVSGIVGGLQGFASNAFRAGSNFVGSVFSGSGNNS